MSLAQAMARQAGEHEIWIALNNRFPETIETIRLAFEGLVPHERIAVFDVPGPAAEQDPANAWRCRAAERVRENFLARLAPDFVHVSSLFEGLGDDAVTSVGYSNSQFDTAVTLFDLIPLLRQETYLTDPRIRDWYFRKLQALKNAGLLLAISESARREAISALQFPEDRAVNISSAVDTIFRRCDLSPEDAAALHSHYGLTRAFVMYTGGIDYRKNIEGLIEAYALLSPLLRTQYQLAIICKVNANERQRLKFLVSSWGLEEDEVVFTGFVSDEDIVALYNECALFVFPSLHEGFGLPALEAMSCGAAVIGSNTSSIPEVIGLEDALFDPTDANAIAAKIHQVLTDDSFRAALRQHGLEQAKQFSWDASAKRVIAAFESHRMKKSEDKRLAISASLTRPRLAYISPLPPERSGISDYSAELLPELAQYFEIEVVVDQVTVTDSWIIANFPVRSVAWFEAHADSYDHIIYHFGNSAFHKHMFGLLQRYPGVVVLHDFFLSGILNYLDCTDYSQGAFEQALYASHGYSALIEEQKIGREAATWKYPCNKLVVDRATGIIVHSKFSMRLAEFWYGANSAKNWQHIPLLRACPLGPDRREARKRLGVGDTDFLICSFGILGPAKLNDRLLDAWVNSTLARDERCHLVFVGENNPDSYGEKLTKAIAKSNFSHFIKITGFVTQEEYRAYLTAADVAVQLRSRSLGETSAAILDCLAYGIPTIINAHGSAAELDGEVVLKLNDEFSQAELTEALQRFWKDAGLRESLSHQAAEYIHTIHHPAHVGEMYRDAIEHFAARSPRAQEQYLIRALAKISTPIVPTEHDFLATASSIASNRPSVPPRQMLVDVSELVQQDAKSGIQRVVRSILNAMLNDPPAGFRVEPVYSADGFYLYARDFTLGMVGALGLELEDAPIEIRAGDVFLGLDLCLQNIPQNKHIFADFRNRGVQVFFVVYDLLPILLPQMCEEKVPPHFERWLATVTTVSDGVVCISRSVADEVANWLKVNGSTPHRPFMIDWFHLGADVDNSLPSKGLPSETNTVLDHLRRRNSFLMVGTIEPRKGHAQALDAFEQLWLSGVDVNLVIVGKQGWQVENFAKRIRSHPELNERLFWLEGISDEYLEKVYATSTCLIAASYGEGFGLPLIEAAQHKLPIFARDIPVFREVAGEHASYFFGATSEALADALDTWLKNLAEGRAPKSDAMPWLTWKQSTQQLIDILSGKLIYAMKTMKSQ